MYWRHFNLTAEPFSLTPDPSFLYLSPVHAEAYAAMTMGLRERRGLITMVGEVGTGKTTLVYSLLSGLGPEIHTAYISNARLSFDGILRAALRDFGVPCEGVHVPELLDAFNQFLLKCAEQNSTAALVIDEAQNLSPETFEDLRLLSNFETYTEKLLQIVLVGQPELDMKLRDPSLRQVAERVAVRCVVNPLTRAQTEEYLEHRLSAVNGSADLFTRAARRLLIAASQGIPRSVNILAHNAMLFAYGEGQPRVTRRYVAAAIREKTGRGLVRLWRRPRQPRPVAAAKPQRSGSSFALLAAALGGVLLGLVIAGGAHLATRGSTAPVAALPDEERGTQDTPGETATVSTEDLEPSGSPEATAAEPEPSGTPLADSASLDPHADTAVEPVEPEAVPSQIDPSNSDPVGAPAVAETVPEVPVAAPADRQPAEPLGTAEAAASDEAADPQPSPGQGPASLEEAATTTEPAAPAEAAAAPSAAPVESTSNASPAEPVAAKNEEEPPAEPAAVASPAPSPATPAEVPPRAPSRAAVAARPAPPAPAVRAAPRAPASPPAAARAPSAPANPTAATASGNTTESDRVKVVKVPEGSSLSDLMLTVYGQYSSRMVARVQAENPQVTDPDRILAGDNLRFPESPEDSR